MAGLNESLLLNSIRHSLTIANFKQKAMLNMEFESMDVGDRLRYFRIRNLGLTQSLMAKQLGVARALVGLVETGAQNPSRKYLQSLKDRYGLSLDWVMTGSGPMVIGEPRIANSVGKNRESEAINHSAAFSYAGLSGYQLGLRMANDRLLVESCLFEFLETGEFDVIAKRTITGREIEILRSILADYGDHSIEAWRLAVVSMVRCLDSKG